MSKHISKSVIGAVIIGLAAILSGIFGGTAAAQTTSVPQNPDQTTTVAGANTAQSQAPVLKMDEWVKFEDEDGMTIQLKIVSSKEEPTKMSRIDAVLTASGEKDGEIISLTGKVIAFNKGSYGFYYRVRGLASDTGQEDYVFEVPALGGKGCGESFKYIDEAIKTYGVTREGLKDGFRISFK